MRPVTTFLALGCLVADISLEGSSRSPAESKLQTAALQSQFEARSCQMHCDTSSVPGPAATCRWQLRSYTGSNKYSVAILGYVMAAGVATSVFAPSFGGLYKKEQELEGETVPGHSSAQTAPVWMMDWKFIITALIGSNIKCVFTVWYRKCG